MHDLNAAANDPGEILLPPSGLDHFDQLVDDLKAALGELLEISDIRYDNINRRSSNVVVIGWNPWRWKKLPADAAPKVGAAREALRKLTELAATAARGVPDCEKELEKPAGRILELIEQGNGSRGAPKSSLAAIRDYAEEQCKFFSTIVRQLPAAFGTEEKLLIADTSALLDRPDLQEWRLDGSSWTVILLPQVLSELDEKKRDPRTRDAAQRVINQVEDFDRRGDTFAGVPLAGKVTVKEVPISPDMDSTLSWLRPDVPDDVIVAGALELGLRNLRTRLAVTASDRNLRNKARLAGLAVIRPQDL